MSFGGVKHTYNFHGSFLGYSGRFDSDVIRKVQKHPDVLRIERDSEIRISSNLAGILATAPLTQNGATWGLARISHRERLGFSTFTKYLYAADAGKDVNVYLLDTGINIDHRDFEGRASWGTTTTDDNDDDMDGRGTHTAALIAGAKFGIAKRASVTAVKVLNSGEVGELSNIIKGFNWVVDDHKRKSSSTASFKGSVAVFGAGILGGDPQSTFAMAVNATISAGIHFAIAAGNDNHDACDAVNGLPKDAIVVGASTLGDERAYFSSFGRCLDLFAPGLNINSAWSGSTSAINTLSGTSTAAAHVAGTLAYLLSLQPDARTARAMSPAALRSDLVNIATYNVLASIPEYTPNLLLWNGGGESDYSKIVGERGNAQDFNADL
ncbi:serine protease [Trapelia coarctata]|nr:serine protease [Trapelia coarctata]